jgi:hypothetical protein
MGNMDENMGAMAMPHHPSRQASGTGWQPDSTPQTATELMFGEWMAMYEGTVTGIYDYQGGRRGAEKGFSSSMAMFMIERSFDKTTIGFHSMVSLDPAMGKKGYPLLLQNGETADGIDPLIDRQHPHDLFMELALMTSMQINQDSSVFWYVGLPGEPALGPPAFMHRFSGMNIPSAPISHHWLDSTHITYGVITAGYIWDRIKIEGSSFRGREPDEHRWDIEEPKLDSYSARISCNVSDAWSLQASYGHIDSPEQLTPDVNTDRFTISASYNRKFKDADWQTMFAWGRNSNSPGDDLHAFLLESTVVFKSTHTVFARLERVQKDELFHDDPQYPQYEEKSFDVNKTCCGYIYDFPRFKQMRFGIGGSIDINILPQKLHAVYGRIPIGYMAFGRLKF